MLSLFVCKSLRMWVGILKSLSLLEQPNGEKIVYIMDCIYNGQLSLSPWASMMLMPKLPHCRGDIRTDESRCRSDQCGHTQVSEKSVKAAA